MNQSPDNPPVTALKGVGPKVAEKLQRIGLHSVQDLLFHLPLRYQDRTRIVRLGSLRIGQESMVDATVELTEIGYGRRRSLLCRISDGSGFLTLRFFHFSAAQQNNLARGRRIRCFGEVRFGPGGKEMVHPEYELYEGAQAPEVEDRLTPVYPTTEGLHQIAIRKFVRQALDRYLSCVPELLPPQVLQPLQLPTLQEAVAYVQGPPPGARLDQLEQGHHPAQQRLAFEELLAHHLSLRRLRDRRRQHGAPAIKDSGDLVARMLHNLPFALTAAQQQVLREIDQDILQPVPMQRLLQGDVGSGKTIVAALAALKVVAAGYQVAVMAPTEILAEQHFRNFAKWLAPLNVDVAWLSGKQKKKERESALELVSNGTARVVVGTHALFQEAVIFERLGLVVVDEQHRFGVHQRLALREKGSGDGVYPHQLIMTATPIPRTLAMTFYADLDLSVLDEMPPGRRPVDTVVLPDSRREEVVARVRDACRAGRRAYWVCPLVEESEALQAQAATETRVALAEALPEVSIGLVHGRMKPGEKEQAMSAFKTGKTRLLVATTVVEVGVDVPEASLMIIENSERLGLSQLHQLRGRVGRGAEQSSCVLMYHAPLSELAKQRLATLRETSDGFEVARKDLELRGPGEVLGTRQTGLQSMRIADLLRDQALLAGVEQAAGGMLLNHPARVQPLIDRWLGTAVKYGDV